MKSCINNTYILLYKQRQEMSKSHGLAIIFLMEPLQLVTQWYKVGDQECNHSYLNQQLHITSHGKQITKRMDQIYTYNNKR